MMLFLVVSGTACREKPTAPPVPVSAPADCCTPSSVSPVTSQPLPASTQPAEVTQRGSIEVTARLIEIPDGAIFKKQLYDYATVLKYQVLSVQRGTVNEPVIYVAHYNPFKPRSQAADRRVREIGGNLDYFAPGQVHHMALEGSADDHYLGGIINLYFEEHATSPYWAVWTDELK